MGILFCFAVLVKPMVQIINSGLNVQDPACELELSVFTMVSGSVRQMVLLRNNKKSSLGAKN